MMYEPSQRIIDSEIDNKEVYRMNWREVDIRGICLWNIRF